MLEFQYMKYLYLKWSEYILYWWCNIKILISCFDEGEESCKSVERQALTMTRKKTQHTNIWCTRELALVSFSWSKIDFARQKKIKYCCRHFCLISSSAKFISSCYIVEVLYRMFLKSRNISGNQLLCAHSTILRQESRIKFKMKSLA